MSEEKQNEEVIQTEPEMVKSMVEIPVEKEPDKEKTMTEKESLITDDQFFDDFFGDD